MDSGDNSDTIASGSKRSLSDIGDDENDNVGLKKVCTKVEAEMIFSLQERLQECKDDLASFRNEIATLQVLWQNKLDSAKAEFEAEKSELNEWRSAFEKESFVPARTSPEPGFVIDYIEKLRSSETALKEQLEIAQMKLAIHDLKAQLKAAPMQRFKTNGDPEVESKQGSTATAGPSHKVAHVKEVEDDKNDGGTYSPPAWLDELGEFEAAKQFITSLAELKESQATWRTEIDKVQAERVASLMEMEKKQAERDEKIENYGKAEKYLLQKFPSLIRPSASEDADK